MTATDTAVLTRQQRDYRQRPTVWIDAAGQSLSDLLAYALRGSTERVMLCGPLNRDTIDRLAFATPPDGWVVANEGHYLGSVESATLRFEHQPSDRRVDLVSAVAWFGQRPADVCGQAMVWLIDELSNTFNEGQRLAQLATPAAQGRDLVLRALPHGAQIPTLTSDEQAWWRMHTTQGRWELLDNADGAELADVFVFDQRFAYSAHCWELGVGPVEWDHGNAIEIDRRGMYELTWRVPEWWDHVGLAPVPDSDGATWRWPNRPGEQHRGWVDGSEAELLARHGWLETIHTRALLSASRPLDTWAKRIVRCRDRLAMLYRQHGGDALHAAADGLRMVLLATVGAMHGRDHAVTRSVPASRASEVPGWARDVRQAEGMIVWREDQPAAWPAMSHPEWTAQIWARARRRLLTSRDERGALHVPRESVVAFRGDALYLDLHPRWFPSGRVGELRQIDHVPGPVDYPQDHRQLLALRGL